LIDAFLIFSKNRDDTELHLYGSKEDDENAYEKMVLQSSKQSSAIKIHPWTEEWAAELRFNDIFVHLGNPESFGIVILEAFARGLRLVVLPDTFLEEIACSSLPDGITTIGSTDPNEICKGLKRSFAISPDTGWYDRRLQYAPLFGAAGKRESLQHLYLTIQQTSI
tara:strand:+ start:9402 stop:9899 length:498 start_codon:yes stop_codon:yes gene_type:complete